MKKILISLSLLVTLVQANDHKHYDHKITTEKTASWLRNDLAGDFIQKYLPQKRTKDKFDSEIARGKAMKLQRARASDERLNENTSALSEYLGREYSPDKPLLRMGYHVDPVLNQMRRANSDSSKSGTDSRSSSREFNDWKRQWEDQWLKRKLEVANITDPGGDRVNMIAARPWGVPCGDPAQHDMPWGSCVLAVECHADYRIYRGDYFCGRTQFICCALVYHTYDLYQGFDVSLARSSMETDSAERRERSRIKTSKERKKKAARRKRRRKRVREERKRKIRRTIAKIVKEVRRILNKAYRNGTRIRKRKTKTMKKFIKFLKRQYKMDRESAKDIHENQMFDVDQDLMNRLLKIKDFNQEFMTNDTFRSILLNNTISYKAARMLTEAYPELVAVMPKDLTRRGEYDSLTGSARRRGDGDASRRSGDASRRRGDISRRRGDASRGREDASRRREDTRRRDLERLRSRRRKYLDYDVEYGLLYD